MKAIKEIAIMIVILIASLSELYGLDQTYTIDQVTLQGIRACCVDEQNDSPDPLI